MDEEWTKTGGDFKQKLEKLGVEITEVNLLESPELAEKLAPQIDPYDPFSSRKRFFLNDKEVSKEEFFTIITELKETKSGG